MPKLRQILISALLCTSACSQGPQGAEAFEGPVLRSLTVAGEIEIQVLAEGTGEAAAVGDWVLVHYRLVLEDGREADSSHNRKPLGFFLGRDSKIIEGFHLGVEGMKVGELRRAIVPPHFAYGQRKMGPIPPKSTLAFELELMRVSK